MTDADGENTETNVWSDYALAFQYLTAEDFEKLEKEGIEIGKTIDFMITNPDKF